MEQPDLLSDPLESENGTSGDEGDAGESEGEAVQTLVAGRERRQKAANRYGQLLLLAQQEQAQEEGQDDLALLFQEEDEAEDIEFEDPDELQPQSDVEDELSSDEEDRGPAAGENDLEGEVQLEKEERAKRRANKRKADKAFVQPPARRKTVKIDEAATKTATAVPLADRQRKKSERVSWLPTGADAPVRTSSRTLSVQNKAKTILSMKQSERRRLSQIANMMEAQKRKEATKVEPMTQAERMAEAAKTERLNSKSLNKWEETEKDRLDKQKARLEALQNRKLEGPVIRWYSGPAEWVDGKLSHVGKRVKVEELEVASEREKTANNAGQTSTPRIVVEDVAEVEPPEHANTEAAAPTRAPLDPTEQKVPPRQPAALGTNVQDQPIGTSGFLDGLEYYASLSEDSAGTKAAPPEGSEVPPAVPASAVNTNISASTPDKLATEPSSPASSSMAGVQEPQSQLVAEGPSSEAPVTTALETSAPASAPIDPPAPPPLPSKPEISTRNLLTLINFDSTAVRDKDVQRRILFGWSPPTSSSLHPTTTTRKYTRASGPAQSIFTPGKPIQPLCAITASPAKYRDPATGLPYASMDAFKAIKRLVDGKAQRGPVWSSLLGAWVGPGEKGPGGMGMRVARGVPEGFARSAAGVGEAEKEVKTE